MDAQGAIVYQKSALDQSYGIYPLSRWRRVWEYVMLFSSLISIYQLPVEWFVQLEHTPDYVFPSLILDVLFAIDVYITFHTGIVKYGLCCLDRISIMSTIPVWKRIMIWVMPIPFYLIGYFAKNDILYMVLLAFKALRFIRYHDATHTIKFTLEYINPASRLFLTFLDVLTFVEISAAILTFIAIKEYPGPNWLTDAGFEMSTPMTNYLMGFYFATTRVFTVGYGDINPKTFLEVCALLVVDLAGIMYFNWFLIKAITLFSRPVRRLLFNKFYHLKISLVNKGINAKLIDELERYYGFVWQNERDWTNFYQSKEKLPLDLNKELCFNLRENLFANLDALHIDKSKLKDIALIFKPRIFRPGESLVLANQTRGSMFILVDGNIEIYSTSGGLIGEADENSGYLIGKESVMNNIRETEYVIAQTYIEAVEIRKSDLKEIRRISEDFYNILYNSPSTSIYAQTREEMPRAEPQEQELPDQSSMKSQDNDEEIELPK